MYVCDSFAAYGRCSLCSPLFPSASICLTPFGAQPLDSDRVYYVLVGAIFLYIYILIYQILISQYVMFSFSCHVIGVQRLYLSLTLNLYYLCVPVCLFPCSHFRELCSIALRASFFLPCAHFCTCFSSLTTRLVDELHALDTKPRRFVPVTIPTAPHGHHHCHRFNATAAVFQYSFWLVGLFLFLTACDHGNHMSPIGL